ncbi:unnamed protein product [Oikopleura dioica]|uniref:Uncharacterized protein n=1 Tax=Oikopleura dioica TaxID=34765 RepID=E4XC49_OIKDI|nr:unnamed protein product [Oikopleura dioica]
MKTRPRNSVRLVGFWPPRASQLIVRQSAAPANLQLFRRPVQLARSGAQSLQTTAVDLPRDPRAAASLHVDAAIPVRARIPADGATLPAPRRGHALTALARRAPPCLHPGPGAALGATRRAAQTHTAVDRAVEATARPVHDRARARLPQDPAPEAEATPVPVQGQDLAIELVLGVILFQIGSAPSISKLFQIVAQLLAGLVLQWLQKTKDASGRSRLDLNLF